MRINDACDDIVISKIYIYIILKNEKIIRISGAISSNAKLMFSMKNNISCPKNILNSNNQAS